MGKKESKTKNKGKDLIDFIKSDPKTQKTIKEVAAPTNISTGT